MIFQAPGCKKIRFAAAFRRFLRRIGWHVSLSDNDIRDILRRSRNAMRKRTAGIPGGNIVNSTEKAYSSTGKENLSVGTDENGSVRSGTDQNGVRFAAAALRRDTDPNTAGKTGQLRDGNVPHADGFMEWAGLEGSRLYADYEFLYGRHSKYFKDPEHARAAVELVLSAPEKVQDIAGNLSFAGRDANSGDIYRIEISPVVKRKENHIRSIFKITPEQYDKIKLEESPVLQLSSTEGQTVRKTRTLSSFVRYDSAENADVKPDSENNLRFSVAPPVKSKEFKEWFGNSKVVDTEGKPLVVYHGTKNGAFTVFSPGLGKGESASAGSNLNFFSSSSVIADGYRDVEHDPGEGVIYPVFSIADSAPEKYHKIFSKNREKVSYDPLNKKIIDGIPEKWIRIREYAVQFPNGYSTVFFSLDAAKEYAKNKRNEILHQTIQDNQRLMPVYLSIQNPLVIDLNGGIFWKIPSVLSKKYKHLFPEAAQRYYSARFDYADEIREQYRFMMDYLEEIFKTTDYDGAIIKNVSDAKSSFSSKIIADTYIVPNPEQIKSADAVTYDDNGEAIPLSERFKKDNPDIRFSYPGLREMSEEDFAANPKVEAWAKVMMPEVSKGLAVSDIDAAERFLTENGIDIDHVRDGALVRQAWLLAGSMYRQYRTKRNGFEAMEFYRSSHPLFDYIANFASSPDWKINPGSKYRGSGFSGTFLSPEFRKNSGALKQRKNESNADFARRQRQQTEKLDNAPGIRLDEVATAYANEYGLDAISVEKEIMDLLGTLTRRDILSEYSRFKRESAFADRELERRYAEEWMLSENARIENEAAALLENAGNIEITPEWIDNNRPVYKVLYNMIFDKDAPYSPSKSDMAAINAAMRLANAPDAASDVAENTRIFNEQLQNQIDGILPSGHVYQLGMPSAVLRSTGIPDLPIELASSRLAEKAKQQNHPFDISEIKNLPQALQNPVAVFRYGDANKAQNIIVDIQQGNKNFLVGLHLNADNNGLTVNSIRGLFPKDTEKWLQWIQDGRALYLDKEKIRTMITQQRTNLADVGYLDLDSINNIVENFENASQDARKSARQIAAAYKAAREQAFNEFREKLRDFKQSLNADRVDAEKLRQEAFALLEDKIPPEYRGEFARAVSAAANACPAAETAPHQAHAITLNIPAACLSVMMHIRGFAPYRIHSAGYCV